MMKQIKRTKGTTIYYIYKQTEEGYYTMNKENGKISHAIKPKEWFETVHEGYTIDEVMQELGYKPNPSRMKGAKKRKQEGVPPRRDTFIGMKFRHEGQDYTLQISRHGFLYDENGGYHDRTECYFYPLKCKNGRLSRDRRNYPKGVKIIGIDTKE